MTIKTIQALLALLMATFLFPLPELNAQEKNTSNYFPKEQPDWSRLIENANREALSSRDSSDSPLERDLKRNLDNWGNKDQVPFFMQSDSIFYRVYYAENVYDMLIGLADFKERFIEMQKYTKPFESVQVLLDAMARCEKTLFFIMVSQKSYRENVISLQSNDYILFGSKAE